MYNYIYKITNLINSKIYIGVHRTTVLDDGYMGSGKVIKSAIKKYGLEYFRKDILEFFDTYEDALKREKEIVTDEFLLREDVYNLRRGGTGGFDYINKSQLSVRNITKENSIDRSTKANARLRELRLTDPQWWEKKKQRTSLAMKGRVSNFLGKKHTEETKVKQSESHKGQNTGPKNSQYGTCWITNIEDKKSIKISKEELDYYTSLGWQSGRKMKF